MKLTNLNSKKFLSITLILAILIQSSPILASDGLFFDEQVTKQLLVDYKFLQESNKNYEGINNALNKEVIKLYQIKDNLNIKIDGLEKDKVDLRVRGDKMENELKSTNEKLVKCISDKPSRWTWFGIGFVSAIVIGTVAAFSISK